MRKIKLSQGKYALVDNEDFDVISKYKWYYANGYAQRSQYMGGGRSNKKVIVQQMHRLIMGSPDGKMVDHKNHDCLDNRKSNLRVCSRTENRRNARKHSNNKSGYKGVWFENGKFRSAIWNGIKNINLGTFSTAKEAALAYDSAAISRYGEFAYTNIERNQ